MKCYIRTVCSQIKVSFTIYKILYDLHSTYVQLCEVGTRSSPEMQVKLGRQTKEVPTRTRSRFQNIFSCNLPPKRCSFKTKNSMVVLCQWRYKCRLNHQAVTDLLILQTPHTRVQAWLRAVTPRGSKLWSLPNDGHSSHSVLWCGAFQCTTRSLCPGTASSLSISFVRSLDSLE